MSKVMYNDALLISLFLLVEKCRRSSSDLKFNIILLICISGVSFFGALKPKTVSEAFNFKDIIQTSISDNLCFVIVFVASISRSAIEI